MRTRHGVTFAGEDLCALVWELVRTQGFSTEEFVVAGSAPLWANGVLERVTDFDLVAVGATWERAWDLGVSGQARITLGSVDHSKNVTFFDGRIEVSAHWLPPHSDPHRLIDEADEIDGIRFCSLATLIEYKRAIDRSKDRADLIALRSARPDLFV